MQDVTLYITDRKGEKHTVIAPTDMAMNVMEIVKSYEIEPEGTIGVCGGMAMCASCQCYVTSNHKLNTMEEEENAMLAEAFNVQNNSRLSCQLPITEALHELEIELAPEV